MLSWVVLNFILTVHSNDSQLIYSLIRLLAMARRVIWIRSVRVSVQKFSWNWLFSFFRGLNIFVRGPCGVVYDSQIFWKKCFNPEMGKIGQAQGSLVLSEESSVFFLVLYLGNFIFGKILVSEISPKMLLANQIAGFFNQLQDSKIGCISQRK